MSSLSRRLLGQVKSTLQIGNDYSVVPAGLSWRSNTFFIVSTVAVGLFTDLFLYGLVVPILPYMLQDRVGLPDDQVQSNVDGLLAAYAGASVLFSPVAGYIADKTSTRQAPFLLGLVALMLATLLLFLGTNMPVLVVARLLQGISGGFVWTIGLALCLETVGPENLGKTIGSIFSFISVGNLLAPLLGGVLYEKTGYAGVFGIGLAILAIDFIMRVLVIEKKVAKRYGAADPQSVEDLEAVQDHNTDGHDSGQAHSGQGEEEPLLGKKEKNYFKLSKDQPSIARKITILPCMTDPRLLTALLVAFVQALLLGSFDATVPTTAKELFGFNSLKGGLLFLPLGAFDLVIGPLAGWFVDRYGTKPCAVIGYGFLVPVLVLLRLPHPGGKDQILLYGGLLALCGIGLAIIGAPSIVEAGSVVQKYYEANPDFFGEQGPYAQLYGLNSMIFSLGLAVGPALAGELKQVLGYGKPALTVFESSSPLPFLYSFSIYFTHSGASPDNCHAGELYQTITQGPLYGSNVVEFHLDLYFIPSGSQEDFMKHYRAEKNSRGSFWTQVDAVGRDERPSDNNTKMPGLVPSYVHDKARYRYHSLIYICDEVDWRVGDQIMKRVEFDPLSREDYEEFGKDPEDPREPDVLPDTDVGVEALSESSPGYGRQLPAPRFSVGSMGYYMWDRVPQQNFGQDAWQEARNRGWTAW
ncbi:membrane transporter [Diaporthe eres]|nr:membrane transporter [Diaporthe eres]